MRRPEVYLGKPVRSLQTMLRQISDHDARILPLIPDGTYGPNTYASVRSFQQAMGLPDTGEADGVTWAAVSHAHSSLLPKNTPPALQPIWSAGRIVEPGERNRHLVLVQAMLQVLAEFFPALEPPQLSGILDLPTQAALQWLQRAALLPDSGALDAATWLYLNGLYRTMAADGTCR